MSVYIDADSVIRGRLTPTNKNFTLEAKMALVRQPKRLNAMPFLSGLTRSLKMIGWAELMTALTGGGPETQEKRK